MNSFPPKGRVSLTVVSLSPFMARPVNLNCNPQLGVKEIRDESADRNRMSEPEFLHSRSNRPLTRGSFGT